MLDRVEGGKLAVYDAYSEGKIPAIVVSKPDVLAESIEPAAVEMKSKTGDVLAARSQPGHRYPEAARRLA